MRNNKNNLQVFRKHPVELIADSPPRKTRNFTEWISSKEKTPLLNFRVILCFPWLFLYQLFEFKDTQVNHLCGKLQKAAEVIFFFYHKSRPGHCEYDQLHP
jgi:hypothetical protein